MRRRRRGRLSGKATTLLRFLFRCSLFRCYPGRNVVALAARIGLGIGHRVQEGVEEAGAVAPAGAAEGYGGGVEQLLHDGVGQLLHGVPLGGGEPGQAPGVAAQLGRAHGGGAAPEGDDVRDGGPGAEGGGAALGLGPGGPLHALQLLAPGAGVEGAAGLQVVKVDQGDPGEVAHRALDVPGHGDVHQHQGRPRPRRPLSAAARPLARPVSARPAPLPPPGHRLRDVPGQDDGAGGRRGADDGVAGGQGVREVVQGAGDGPLAEGQTGGEGGRPLRGAVEEVDAGGAGRREGQGGRLAGDAGPEDGHLLPPQRAQLHRRDVDGDGGDGGVAVEPAQLAHPPARFQGVLEGEVQLRAQGALGGAGQEGLPHLADDLALAQGQAVQAGGHPDQVLDGVHPAAGKDVGAQVSQRHPGLRRQEALQAGGRSRGALRGPGVDLQAVAGDQGHRRPHGLPHGTAEGGLPLPGAGGGEGLPHGHVGRVVGDAGQHQRTPPSAAGRSGGHRPPPAGARAISPRWAARASTSERAVVSGARTSTLQPARVRGVRRGGADAGHEDAGWQGGARAV